MTKESPKFIAVLLQNLSAVSGMVGRVDFYDMVISNPNRHDIAKMVVHANRTRDDNHGIRAIKFVDNSSDGSSIQRVLAWPANGWYHRDFEFETVRAFGKRMEFEFDKKFPYKSFSSELMDEIMKWVSSPYTGPEKPSDLVAKDSGPQPA